MKTATKKATPQAPRRAKTVHNTARKSVSNRRSPAVIKTIKPSRAVALKIGDTVRVEDGMYVVNHDRNGLFVYGRYSKNHLLDLGYRDGDVLVGVRRHA